MLMFIDQGRIGAFWQSVCVGVLAALLFYSSAAMAAGQHQRGYKGSIGEKALIAELQNIQGNKAKFVEGYVINGNDIIDIIRTTKLDIRIRDAVIDNGLDFSRLDPVPIDRLIAAEKDPRKKKHLEDLKKHFQKLWQVKTAIYIRDSDIHPLKRRNRAISIWANQTVFEKPTYFRSVTFSGDVDFDSATFGSDVIFHSTLFSSLTVFSSATFSSFAGFNLDTFSDVEFNSARFAGDVSFSSTSFSSHTNFLSATFSSFVDFSSATFASGDVNFSSTSFRSLANFDSARFAGGVDFRAATFASYANFSSATFSDSAHFDLVTFGDIAVFRLAAFRGDASFREATFSKLAYFSGATFGKATLIRTQFAAYADFRDAHIQQLDMDNSMSPFVIQGRVDFRNATIGSAHIQDVIFGNDADFSNVRFGMEPPPPAANGAGQGTTPATLSTVFRYVTFEREARFNRALFRGNVAFENTIFKGRASFVAADLRKVHKLSLSYISFNNIELDWASLPTPSAKDFSPWVSKNAERVKSFKEIGEDKSKAPESSQSKGQKPRQELEPLSRVFGQLEDAFKAQKRLADANEADYFKQLAELREHPTLESRLWYDVWGLPAGYGTKIWRLLIVSGIIWLLFALLYVFKAELNRALPPESQRDFSFRLRLLDLPKQFYKPAGSTTARAPAMQKWIDAMRFSWVILFKVGYRDTSVTGSIFGMDLKYVIWFEWALGYAVLAAIVVTLSNTMPLANSLIHGLL